MNAIPLLVLVLLVATPIMLIAQWCGANLSWWLVWAPWAILVSVWGAFLLCARLTNTNPFM